ncbi:MAG: DUF4114 domain-containing protein [Candidatus Hydrogenedentes bacterium]|nr:DUF4114 domain-containing protein [Candidatus Hydrogenedentota bacterium]
MKMKSVKLVAVAIAATVLAIGTVANATTINDPWAPYSADSSEQNLYQIYNSLYGTSYASGSALPQVSPDEIFNLLGGAGVVQAEARYAGLGQQFGFYQPTDGSGPITYTQVFDVQNPNSGSPLAGFSQVISPTGDFGFYDLAGGVYWHSQAGLNPNQEDHMVTLATADPNVFLLAFEDLPFALSDQDYNDLVVQLTVRPGNIVPEPTSMALLGIGLAGMVVRKMRGKAK